MIGRGRLGDGGSDQLSRGRTFRKLAKKWSRGPRNPEIWPPGGVKIDPPKSGPSPRKLARKPRNSGSQDPKSRNRPKSYYDRYPGLSSKTTEYNLSHPRRICANWAPRGPESGQIWPPGPGISRNWDPPQARWSESGVSGPGPGESGQIPWFRGVGNDDFISDKK